MSSRECSNTEVVKGVLIWWLLTCSKCSCKYFILLYNPIEQTYSLTFPFEGLSNIWSSSHVKPVELASLVYAAVFPHWGCYVPPEGWWQKRVLCESKVQSVLSTSLSVVCRRWKSELSQSLQISPNCDMLRGSAAAEGQ